MPRFAVAWLVLLGLGACADRDRRAPVAEPAPAPEATAAALATAAVAAVAAVAEEEPAPAGACAADMSLVEGRYCLTPEHRCLEHQNVVGEGGKITPNQCTRYKEPVVCYADRRKAMRYCMDPYEWPNKRGELPRTLVSWQSAKGLCASAGKRLCTEEEFNFACEGEDMKPFVYGFARDKTQCNFDKPYRPRTFAFTEWDTCKADPACRAAYEAIDQRQPAGAQESCRSPDGIYDLIGNANEWVVIPDAKSPHRSGLKGGWWGPVRDRCRPTVTFHDEGDFGYEVGFRCCSDAATDG